MKHRTFDSNLDNNPDNDLVIEIGARNVAVSGIVGSAEVWAPVFKARADHIQPVTLMVDCRLGPTTPQGIAATTFKTDLRLRWGDGWGGGGEALLDAAHGQVITVCAGTIELYVNHKGNPVAGGNAEFSCSGFCGTVPHPRPLRSQGPFDIAAGATSARFEIPAWTSAIRLGGFPEPDPTLILRSYGANVAATTPVTESTGSNHLASISGTQFVDVENAGPNARSVVIVYELAF